MICFEDNFTLLWLYYLKLLLQFFRNYYRLFFLSCPTTKISSFDFTSPFVSWGFPYRGTNFNFLGHNIWIVFNNSAPWRFQFFIKFPQFLHEHGEYCCEWNWFRNVYSRWHPWHLFLSALPCVYTNLQLNLAIKSCSLKELSLTGDCCFAPVYFVFPGYYILNVVVLVLPDKFLCNFSFFILTGVFHGSLRTTHPRAVHSTWVNNSLSWSKI